MWEGRYSEDSFADKPWVVRCKSCDARMAIMPEYGDGNYWWIHGDEGVSHMRDVITESWNTRAERTCENVKGDDCLSFECSQCHGGFSTDPSASASGWDTRSFRYCPHCGARVVVE